MSGRQGGSAPVLKNRNFLLIAAAQLVSEVGDYAYTMAIGLLIVQRTQNPLLLGLLYFVKVLPFLFASPVAGVLADRHEKKAILIWADVLRAGVIFAGVPFLGGPFAVAVLIGVVALVSTFTAVFAPARSAIMPRLVPSTQLLAANSIAAGIAQVTIFLGPVVGAVTTAVWGAPAVLALNGATFVVSALFLAWLPATGRAGGEGTPAGFLAEMRDGLGYIRSFPRLGRLLVALGATNLATGSFPPLLVAMSLAVAARPGVAVNQMMAAVGMGALLAAIFTGGAARRFRLETVFYCASVSTGALVMLLSPSWPLPGYFGMLLLVGFTDYTAAVVFETLVQQRSDPRFTSRVFAASKVLYKSAVAVGTLAYGPLMKGLGLPVVFLCYGALVTVVTAALGFHSLVAAPREESPHETGH